MIATLLNRQESPFENHVTTFYLKQTRKDNFEMAIPARGNHCITHRVLTPKRRPFGPIAPLGYDRPAAAHTFVLLPPPLPLIFLIWTMHHVRHLFVCRAVNFMIQGRKKLRNEAQMKMRAVFILIKIGEAQLPSNSLPLALGSDLKRQQRASWQTMDCNCRVRSWHDKDGGTLGQHTSLYDRDGHNQTSNNQTKMVGHCNTHQQHWNTGQLQHLYRLAGRNSFHLCLCLHLLIGFSILLWLTYMIIVCCASVKKRWAWKFLHIGATRLTFAKKPDRKVARGVGCLFNQNALS